MLKSMNVVITSVLVCLLSACATVNSPGKTEEQTQKIKTAKINAQLGIAYLERHNLQRSKQKLLLALEQAPTIPETWYSMAYFLEATGNKDDASIYYQKAIAVAPKRGDAQNNYGTFLCRNGDYQAAVEHFMVAVKDPTYLDPADAYENAGLCALKIPDKSLASKYFAQALQQDPSRTVSERKLRELNKMVASNDLSETSASNAESDSLDANIPAMNISKPRLPKRIAYNSLKQRHQEEENEDDPNSGLVKVPDLLKAKPLAVTAAATPVSTSDLVEAAQVTPEIATAPAVKAVYRPSSKAKIKGKAMTAQVKATSPAKVKKLAFVNPLTKEKFHCERVSLEPIAKKKVAFKEKHAHSEKLTIAKKPKSVANAKRTAKVKVAHAVSRKHVSVKDV